MVEHNNIHFVLHKKRTTIPNSYFISTGTDVKWMWNKKAFLWIIQLVLLCVGLLCNVYRWHYMYFAFHIKGSNSYKPCVGMPMGLDYSSLLYWKVVVAVSFGWTRQQEPFTSRSMQSGLIDVHLEWKRWNTRSVTALSCNRCTCCLMNIWIWLWLQIIKEEILVYMYIIGTYITQHLVCNYLYISYLYVIIITNINSFRLAVQMCLYRFHLHAPLPWLMLSSLLICDLALQDKWVL